ncbi:MAG TPA: Ig-like domain-containing protein [Bacillota bacterium]|nr:Ig-like domain-containing protein [Bacillota bacterium]
MRSRKWITVSLLVTMLSVSNVQSYVQAEAVTPTSGTTAASTPYNAASLEQLFKSVDTLNGGNWYKGSNNESSTLAWGESYVLRSYLEMYRATGNEAYLQKFIDQSNSVLAQRDSVRKVTIYNGKSLPAWRTGPSSGLKTTGFFHHVAETGMIAYPFADFARLVKQTPALAKYQTTADTYLKAAKDAVGVLKADWRESGNTGYYVFTPGGTFWADGIPAPFNQYAAIARTELAIYQVSGETEYLNRVTKMAQHMKSNMKYQSSYDGYSWNYWYGPGYTGWTAASGLSKNTPSYAGYKALEDVSHGAIETDFIYACAKAGIVFNDTDLQRIGNTIKTQIINRTDGELGYGFGPSTKTYFGNKAYVAMLLRFDAQTPGLLDYSYNIRDLLATAKGPGPLGAALMNKAFSDKNAPAPIPVDTTPPQVSVSSPAASTFINSASAGTMLLQAKASDNVGVKAVNFQITQDPMPTNWQALGTAVNNAGIWQYSWNTAALTEGVWYIRCTAVDAAGNNAFSQPVTVTVDRTSPVVTVSPAGGAVGVAVNSVIKATFSEDVANVNNTTFTVNGVSGTVAYDAASRTATFTPAQALTAGTTYTVNLGGAMADKAGNAVKYTSTFTTVKPVTTTPKQLLVNGNFTQGKTGWYSGTIVKDSTGNQYVTNGYNWMVRQEVTSIPGTKLVVNAQTKKGPSTADARIVLIFTDAAGNKLRTDSFLYHHKGTGWESFPTQTLTKPAGTAKMTIYLLANSGTATHSFDNVSVTAQ